MDFKVTVVVDEACFTKLIHEMAYPRSGCADHLGEGFLSNLRHKRLGPTFLAEIGQQQQQSSKPFLC